MLEYGREWRTGNGAIPEASATAPIGGTVAAQQLNPAPQLWGQRRLYQRKTVGIVMIEIVTRKMEFEGSQVEAWLKGDGANAARIAACGIRLPAETGQLTATEFHAIQPNGSASRGPADWTTELRFGKGFLPIFGAQSFGGARLGIDVIEAPSAVMATEYGRRLADAFIEMISRTQKSSRLRTAFHAFPQPDPTQGPVICWMRGHGTDGWKPVSPRRDEFSAIRLAEVADGLVIGVVGRGIFATTIETFARTGPSTRGGWFQKWTAPGPIGSVSRIHEGQRVFVTVGKSVYEVHLGDRVTASGRMIARHPIDGLVIGRGAHGSNGGVYVVKPGNGTAQVTYLADGFPKPEVAPRSNLAPGERPVTPDAARATGAI